MRKINNIVEHNGYAIQNPHPLICMNLVVNLLYELNNLKQSKQIDQMKVLSYRARYQETYKKKNVDNNKYPVIIILEVILQFCNMCMSTLAFQRFLAKFRRHCNCVSYVNQQYRHQNNIKRQQFFNSVLIELMKSRPEEALVDIVNINSENQSLPSEVIFDEKRMVESIYGIRST